MEIRAKDVLVVDAFAAVFFIVAITIDDLTKRFFIVLEEGAPLVIFKTVVGLVKLIVMNLDVADVAVVLLVEGIVPHDTNAIDFLAVSLDIVLP